MVICVIQNLTVPCLAVVINEASIKVSTFRSTYSLNLLVVSVICNHITPLSDVYVTFLPYRQKVVPVLH
jgi:hypothetical protein